MNIDSNIGNGERIVNQGDSENDSTYLKFGYISNLFSVFEGIEISKFVYFIIKTCSKCKFYSKVLRKSGNLLPISIGNNKNKEIDLKDKFSQYWNTHFLKCQVNCNKLETMTESIEIITELVFLFFILEDEEIKRKRSDSDNNKFE